MKEALVLTAFVVLAGPALADGSIVPGEGLTAWVRPDEAISFEVEGTEAGSLAVFIGATDVTDLFRRRGSTWVYRPELLPLPRGESELVVWRVAAEGWQEAARLPLKVLHRGGLEQRELQLRLDLQGLADLDSGGNQPPPEEESLTAQIDLQQSAKGKGFELRFASNVVGVSEVEQALRFGLEGERAERLDLSSWSLELRRGEARLALGHLSFGDSRQLIQGFASRGARLDLPLPGPLQMSLAAVNGSSIVGWSNFLGLERSEHRVLAGTLGVEMLPARPGGLRLETTVLDGSLLPLAGFNEQAVTDREESEGWSARLRTATADQRFRLEAGVARSRFDNPFDPSLALGASLVPVREESRGAHYGDLSWAILRRQGKKERPLEVALDLRHSLVEPQYRSVAVFQQADRRESGSDLRLSWGGLLGQLSWSSSRDNLDDVPSILTTRTGASGWTFTLPFAQIKGAEPSPWLPIVNLTGQRVHQEGDGVPDNGGFSPSHVPDQVSWNHQLGLQWAGGRWTLGANATLSEQDNRQPGREEADFEQRSFGVAWTSTPWERLDLGLDLRLEEQTNEELQETTEIRTSGLLWTLRLPRRHTVNGNLSWTESETEDPTAPLLRESEALVGDLQWAWAFEHRRQNHGLSGQLYLRWAYQRNDAIDFQFAFDESRTGWKLTGGLNLSLF